MWSAFFIFHAPIAGILVSRLTRNIVPSVIILTEGDERAYTNYIGKLNSSTNTVLAYVGVVIATVAMNVASSFIYAYLREFNL